MRFRFSPKVTLIGVVLVTAMLRLSYWQWERHQGKVALIAQLEQRLAQPVVPLAPLLSSQDTDWGSLTHRRLQITCRYDFPHEVILRNRRHNDRPGAFVLTPCRFPDEARALLVNRGFIPFRLMERDQRVALQKNPDASFTGLIKEPLPVKFLGPKDPESGRDKPWVDAWLRVDLQNIEKQLPYPLLPVYAEIMTSANVDHAEDLIISKESKRDEIFMLSSREKMIAAPEAEVVEEYPVPVFDAVIAPGRHLGYVFEWGLMALMTALTCLILQLRRPKQQLQSAENSTPAPSRNDG